MECEARQRQIGRLADGEVANEESAELFGHLGACPECREFHFRLQRLNRSLERVRDAEVHQTLEAARHVGRVGSMPLRSIWSSRVAVRFPVAALLLCTLVIGIFFAIQGGLTPAGREKVYITKLPEIVIIPNAEGSTNRH